jgi:chromosome segregation ATPase
MCFFAALIGALSRCNFISFYSNRLKKAVFLAKQLLEKERALEAQTAVLEKARSEAANQRARIAELEHHVSCAVSQPSRMVLGELERSEAEVVRLKGSLEEAVARADEYATALREAQEAREDAENDLASVLDKQGELRQMVEALQHQQQQEQREQEHQQREQQQRLSNLRGPPSPHTFYRHGIPPGSPQFHTRSSPAR